MTTTDPSNTSPEPDLYLTDCCFGDTGTPGVDCDCAWGSEDDSQEAL